MMTVCEWMYDITALVHSFIAIASGFGRVFCYQRTQQIYSDYEFNTVRTSMII